MGCVSARVDLLANRHTIAGKLEDHVLGFFSAGAQTLNPITNIRIRFATIGEADAIADLLSEAFAEYESLYTPEGFAATAITSRQIVVRMSEGPVWVAVRDEVIVGTGSAVAKGESLYIRGMGVHPSARGQRIGELLLIQIEQFAISQGFSRQSLSTTPFLDRAIRLYEKFGFRRTDEGPNDLFGTPLFTMEKNLER